MTVATIWQRGHLIVIDETAFPIEYLLPSAEAGYACVQVMLNPRHPDTSLKQVSLDYLRKIRSTGMKAFGFVWADSFADPMSCFSFCRDWRALSLEQGCALTGFVINAEDGIEQRDMAGEGWSRKFLARFRSDPLTAKLSLALNTYNGCGGLDLPAWQARGARLYCQTFHEGQTHEWPITGYIPWAKFYGYTAAVSIKPNWAVHTPRPSKAEQIQSAKWAGTVGFSVWRAESGGEPKEHVIPLLKEAIAAGVAY